MAIMAHVLIMNLILDPLRSKEEKLITRPTLSQYPLMIGHMAKANKEIPHHLARITLLIDTVRTKLLPAVRPICHHQSIRHSRYLREEMSYMITMANGDEAMTLAAETNRHNEKLVKMAGPSKGNNLTMTTHIAVATSVEDIPNRYTSDVVLNQQARVAHQGGMADCLPGGPVARETMAVLDAGAHGGSVDRPMVGCLVVHA
jgi:hypothetical protein